jgi:uncharacterized protein (TIGR02099 family)
MKQFFDKLLKIFGYSAATLIVLLAVLVGLFRLFLPRLPEYQEEIKGWASSAIGMQVEFSGMNARWGFSGPELEFYDAELIRPDNQKRAIAADRVGIGISLSSLVFDRNVVVDRVAIRDTSIEVRQLDNGEWWVQGMALGDVPRAHSSGPQRLGEIEIVGEGIDVLFLQPGDVRPRLFRVPSVLVSIDENRVAVDSSVRLPADLGRQVDVSATQLLGVEPEQRSWDIALEASDVSLDGWAQMHDALRGRLLGGEGDIDVSLVFGGAGVRGATAELDLVDVVLDGGEAFEIAGRLEFDRSPEGWLVAAEEFTLATTDHTWPESSLRAEAGVDEDGRIAMLDVRASYLNLADSRLILPLLPEDRQRQLAELDPGGELRELVATVSNLDDETPDFHVEADLDSVGFEATGKLPGIRGFTGYVNGNRAGGRLEIRSTNLDIELPHIMSRPTDLLTAEGTVLWRRSDDSTTILSNSIRIANPVLDMRSSVQLTLDANGGAPDIDLSSTFRISDVGAARRYIPRKVMKEKLYNWFQGSLVSGSIERGSLRLRGPLDKFPFDNGEGRLLIEGSARNLNLKYRPEWPAAEQADVEIVLDNLRLYSVRNRSVHAGNESVNVDIEIADLRDPVLTIKGLVTGTLGTLHDFALQSPIDRFTGGNLARIAVTGEASFNLDLTVPLKNARATTVNGLLRSNNGTLDVEGFNPPITDLIGEVLITRDTISSESLGGRIFGEEVNFRLGPDDDPAWFTVATATGTVTAEGLLNELGVPLEGLIEGAAPFEARILFPRGSQDSQPPFTVRVASPLRGLAFDLPAPLGKPSDTSVFVRGDIRFLPGGERIETSGRAANDVAWDLAFAKPDGAWDLDRGVVRAGGGTIEQAETRGLHLRGRTDTVRLEDWLNLSRGGEKTTGAAERLRSIDLLVDNLFAIGQHLEGHRVRVDRSARDWLVQLEGDDVSGSLFVPYDFGSDRSMVIEMDRMRLPGDESAEPSARDIDPSRLPPITLTANEFALGDRHFGAVDVSLRKIEDGLESERLEAKDASFEFVGSGRWVADDSDPRGSRTTVQATLTSTDVERTLQRLDFAQGISGESLGILFDMNWSGGPRGDFLDVLNGQVTLKLENGQLEEVEPGAGRMLGLVSFVALPRRLSLDFRDVFNKGFRYDSIDGSFDVVDGVASTCDMSLEGPAAIVGMVGRVDIANKQYEQGAVISAQVGNTLPIVGAVVGGPPGAAAMLIFSQIFKKPLQEMGQVYYGISGAWEDPVIDSVSSRDFVRYGELAGCIGEGGTQ